MASRSDTKGCLTVYEYSVKYAKAELAERMKLTTLTNDFKFNFDGSAVVCHFDGNGIQKKYKK